MKDAYAQYVGYTVRLIDDDLDSRRASIIDWGNSARCVASTAHRGFWARSDVPKQFLHFAQLKYDGELILPSGSSGDGGRGWGYTDNTR
jgi:hypothetical protein